MREEQRKGDGILQIWFFSDIVIFLFNYQQVSFFFEINVLIESLFLISVVN